MGLHEMIMISPACMSLDTIMHELLHTLGLMHMHMSTDRDNFVRIDFSNIAVENHFGFDKLSDMDYSYFGTTYDPASIMHYRPYEFAVNPYQKTIYGLVSTLITLIRNYCF